MALFNISFHSNVLTSDTSVTVIIPQKMDNFISKGPRPTTDGKIPVLWLLHGMGDEANGWERYTLMEKYCEARGIAVVTPKVDSLSFYCDMKLGPSYLTYIKDELPSVIHEFFPQLSQSREYNYIAGNSMGGYGAIKVALLQPERFSAVGISSSANFGSQDIDLPPKEQAPSYMQNIYKVPQVAMGVSDYKDALGTEHDIYTLLSKAMETKKQLPKIIQYIGNDDFLLSGSDKLAEFLNCYIGETGFHYEKWAGCHSWSFWNEALLKFLDAIGLNPIVSEK